MPRNERIAVIGLGYVGLPLMEAFAGAGFDVIGFDISAPRVDELNAARDHTGSISPDGLQGLTGRFFSRAEDCLADRNVYILATPTPVDEANVPDFKPLLGAAGSVAAFLNPGDLVIVESTVYPGATEELVGPELSRISGLELFGEIKLGYSPERINPGDDRHTLSRVVKVVAGQDDETLARVKALYETIVGAGVHVAESISIAEASKVIENVQRDINIALVNELAMLFDHMNLDTRAVLRAAGTKWNFLPFKPGLVGGHCIGVDSYYLTYRAEQLDFHTQIISAGRRINDGMAGFVAEKVQELLHRADVSSAARKIAVLGLTFKADVPDLRNSQVMRLVARLEKFGMSVVTHDAIVSAQIIRAETGLDICDPAVIGDADCVILAVPHRAYMADGAAWVRERLGDKAILVDIDGQVDETLLKPGQLYWSL